MPAIDLPDAAQRPRSNATLDVALVKTSSLGDVIHALPVVTDILAACPGARIDWVVEESFAELPALHPGVATIHRVAMRRWRKAPLSAATRAEWARFRAGFRSRRYDLILDLQGLLKSAFLAWQGRGLRAGFDRASAREPLAALFYQRRFRVDQKQHAIKALRALAAQALDYAIDGPPRFALAPPPPERLAELPGGPLAPGSVVLLHMTARAEKQWPAERWRALAQRLDAHGRDVVVPWGNDGERERAGAIALGLARVRVPERLSLSQCAALLAHARAVVGLDTGLTHLAAAYERPLVFMVPDTPRWPRYRAEPFWLPHVASFGQAGTMPAVDDVWSALERLGALE
ncbi:MAG TPA: lipopolysaccharide heptosyltransferase I [Zeimonas sp.]|nr:lipopolysaccharide heptosyltransferase I [Zeimonas sp.]